MPCDRPVQAVMCTHCSVHCSCPDTIQEVAVCAKAGVCEVHVLFEGSVLEKWVLKEMPTAYQVSITSVDRAVFNVQSFHDF